MPVVRRTRLLSASVEEVWRVVGDPHHLPRWWPRVSRVENVHADAFTVVMSTDRGRIVRADQRVVERRARLRCRWRQELEGTPFAKILSEAETTVELEAADGQTRVMLELRQRLRGLSRFGGFMVRRASRAQLELAFDGLEAIVG